MTATLTPRFDNAAFGCGRAQIRAHYRHLATVVTITGLIDNVNVDAVTAYTQRFILAKDPLILDLGEVRISATDALTLLRTLAQDCRAAGVECMVVAPGAMAELAGDNDLPLAGSVHEALHYFADEIDARRRLLLPLIKKSA